MNNSQTPPYALLIIDMINDFNFSHGDLLFEHTLPIIDPILQLKEEMNKRGMPVIYINDHYQLWQADYSKIISACTNSKTAPIIGRISPGDDDYFLIKPKHSAFYGTALNTLLHHLGVKTLILTGIAGNICVLFSANDAYMREYKLWIPSNCIASASMQDNQFALTMMKNVLKAKIDKSGSFPPIL
ncbi:isochorismatase family cysteine hydrolase [Actinomycetes bacterium NPDC127524]